MRNLAGTFVLLLCVSTYAFGQAVESSESACPVDGKQFRASIGELGDSSGGIDSDECRHPLRGQTLPYLIIVCPRCNYAAGRLDFPAERTDEQKRLILREFRTSPYRGVGDSEAEIPGWERFRLAAKCAALLGNARDEINLTKSAAWSARIEACRPATAAYSTPMLMIAPVERRMDQWSSARGMADVMKEIEDRIASTADVEQKARLTLHLAMMAQRAGFKAERDRILARVESSVRPDSPVAASARRFRELAGIEGGFQNRLVELIAKRLENEENAWDRTALTYLEADTLRRLGKDAEALELFRTVRRKMSTPTELRLLTDYYLSLLAPGQPLPVPEPEKTPEAAKTEPAPKPAPEVTAPGTGTQDVPRK